MVKIIIDRISIVLTFILASFTLAGAVASYISPEASYLIAFLGLALPLLLLLNIIWLFIGLSVGNIGLLFLSLPSYVTQGM